MLHLKEAPLLIKLYKFNLLLGNAYFCLKRENTVSIVSMSGGAEVGMAIYSSCIVEPVKVNEH